MEAVTEHAIVVADTANPSGGFSREEYRDFGVTFDTLVWDVDTRNFGEPEDFDENEKVIIFFTRAVNELSEENSNSVVGGFFYGRDLFERTGANACAGSNQGELFYMMVPDPAGGGEPQREDEGLRGREDGRGARARVPAPHQLLASALRERRQRRRGDLAERGSQPHRRGAGLLRGRQPLAARATWASRRSARANRCSTSSSSTSGANFGRFVAYLEEPASASPLGGRRRALHAGADLGLPPLRGRPGLGRPGRSGASGSIS